MSEKGSQVRTGIFVVLGTMLLLLSILFFGGDRVLFKQYQQYRVKFESTQGLAAGSIVSIAGVEVGNVKHIEFDADMQLVTTLNVDKNHAALLNDKSIASLRTQGALGDKYVYIATRPSSGPRLNENDFIPAETQPDIFEMISNKAGDFSVFTETMREMNELLHNLNADRKSALLMENFIKASQNISTLTNDPSLRESFVHLRNVLKKIDAGEGTLGQLINDSTLHERLVGLMGDVPRNRYLKPLLREAIKQNEKQR